MLVTVKSKSCRLVGAISFFLLLGAVAASQANGEVHSHNVTSTTASHSIQPPTDRTGASNSTHKPVIVIPENHSSGPHISSPKGKGSLAQSGNSSAMHPIEEKVSLARSGNLSAMHPIDTASSTSSPRRRKPPDAVHPAPHADVIQSPQADNVVFDVAHPKHPELRTGKFNPTFAAIVAAICITTAVGGYIMLLTWRRVEMERYGNRQMLINEDDFGDIQDEDMRHFEASCIQIEA